MTTERDEELISRIEAANSKLRETIEESKRLVEDSDTLISRVRADLDKLDDE